MKKTLKLTKEARADVITKLKEYFLAERDEEIGDLAASLLLDYIIENIAPNFYNQGIKDAVRFISQKTEELYDLEIYL